MSDSSSNFSTVNRFQYKSRLICVILLDGGRFPAFFCVMALMRSAQLLLGIQAYSRGKEMKSSTHIPVSLGAA